MAVRINSAWRDNAAGRIDCFLCWGEETAHNHDLAILNSYVGVEGICCSGDAGIGNDEI
jgi:hypothetical protein